MTHPADSLSESLENYLEAILHIVDDKQAAKPRDVARKMKVSNSSVTGALRSLAEKGLINYAPFEVVTLTPAGRAIAETMAQRHGIFKDFFVNVLSITPPEADRVACALEHVISPQILERFVSFLKHVEKEPLGNARWIEGQGFVNSGA
jgi:DtxR family Mn-dependent transcriptional regulator